MMEKSLDHVFDRFSDWHILLLLNLLPLFIFALYWMQHVQDAGTMPSLYLAMAEQVQKAGYTLPNRIPHYTRDGIPFAYPPLAFYVLAGIQDLTGMTMFSVAKWLSLVFSLAYVTALYALSKSILKTKTKAAFATAILATSPAIFHLHVSPAGSVRTLAYALTFAGLLTGIRLFRTHERRWVVASAVLFGLTVLTHPMYVPFFGVSYLIFYATFDKTKVGLGYGAVVATAGILLASPWWVTVISRHGVSIFLGASGTHNGLGSGLIFLPVTSTKLWTLKAMQTASLTAWYLMPVGVMYLLVKRRLFLPVWLVVTLSLNTAQRFHFPIEVFIATEFLFGGFVSFLRSEAETERLARTLPVLLVAGIVVFAGVTGALYASGVTAAIFSQYSQHTGVQASDSTSFDSHVEATEWMKTSTDPAATFVVLGPEEDIPYLSNRTVLVVPWGAEWDGPGAYQRQHRLLSAISSCREHTCLTRSLRKNDIVPDYVYVNRDNPVVESLRTTTDYRLAHSNDGVAIFSVRFDSEPNATSADYSQDPTSASKISAFYTRQIRSPV